MEQNKVNRLVRILNKLDPDEVTFVKNTIGRVERNNVSFEEAGSYNKIEPGQTVAFFDRKNQSHSGVVVKANRKWVRILDSKEKINYYVLPEDITIAKTDIEAKPRGNIKRKSTQQSINA